MRAVVDWLIQPDNPVLIGLRIATLLAIWSRVWACRYDHPPWAYVGVLLYLAVGLSWTTTVSLLLQLDLIEPTRRLVVLTMPSVYLLYSAVIVFFLTDRRRVLARQEAVECQIRRAEDLVERADRR